MVDFLLSLCGFANVRAWYLLAEKLQMQGFQQVTENRKSRSSLQLEDQSRVTCKQLTTKLNYLYLNLKTVFYARKFCSLFAELEIVLAFGKNM